MEVRDWLASTTAADVMTCNVRTFRPEETLAEAALAMLDEQHSGAPVVDKEGNCLGVLTLVDLMRADERVAEQQLEIAQSPYFSSGLALPQHVYVEKLEEFRDRIAPTAEHPVREFMTTDLVSVTEQTPLATVVQNMVDAHIHRVVVLDAQQRLLGLISMTDILARLLRA